MILGAQPLVHLIEAVSHHLKDNEHLNTTGILHLVVTLGQIDQRNVCF